MCISKIGLEVPTVNAIMTERSEYFLIQEKPGARDVCISISAAHVKPGSFMLRNVLQDLECHQVFLNCPNNRWYFDGVPGLGQDYAETAQALASIISKLKSKEGRVIVVGGSMGGYAAIILGAWCGANYVFASGVELKLKLAGGISRDLLNGPFVAPDLYSIMENSKTKFILAAGENNPTDMYCLSLAAKMRCANIELISLKLLGHSLPPYLQATYGYKKIITDVLTTGTVDILEGTGDLFNFPEICELLQTLNEIRAGDTRLTDGVVSKLQRISKETANPDARAHAYNGLSQCFHVLGMKDKSVAMAKAATRCAPMNWRFLDQYTRTLLSANQPAAAVGVAETSLHLQKVNLGNIDPFTPILYAKALRQADRLIDAINFSAQILKESPSNVLWELLTELLEDAKIAAKNRDKTLAMSTTALR